MMRNRIETQEGRLVSLDILRGFDMILLTALGGVLSQLCQCIDAPWCEPVFRQLQHNPWGGISLHDLIMPLFMFCAGAAIPYSFAKYVGRRVPKKQAYLRILRRVLIFWVLGMMIQGNLLDLDPSRMSFYCNTLHAIAVGYAFSALMFMHTKQRTRIITCGVLLLIYWACCEFISVDGYGGGSYTNENNFPKWVDIQVLGSGGGHTWVFSSINFIVTVMSGCLAGELLKGEMPDKKKFTILLGTGAAMTAAGWLLDPVIPVIKPIWTSSMVLVTSGYSLILLSICFLISDWKGKRWLHWLIPLGMNCMLAYLFVKFIPFKEFFTDFLRGFEQFLGPRWFPLLVSVVRWTVFMLIFDELHKHKIFFKI